MPDRLPVISGDEFAKLVRNLGYFEDHFTGDHMILRRENGAMLSVPRHKELRRGTLRKLIDRAGLTRHEFMDLYRGK